MGRLHGRGDRWAGLYLEEGHGAQWRQGCSFSPWLVPCGAATAVLGDAAGGGGGALHSTCCRLPLVPTGLTAPARQWTESTAALEWLERGCSQQTETGIWAERRFRTKAWVPPRRQGLRGKEMRTIQERREVQEHPSSSGHSLKWLG